MKITLSLRAIAKQSIRKIATTIGLAMTIFFISILLLPNFAFARDVSTITDWYIKDFKSEITVNTDSSLLITEKIVADCGNLPDKHGIFRTLPTYYQKSSDKKITTPIELTGITDFSGKPVKYTETKNFVDKTVTWKIGDPDKTVTGENNYQISYKVKNAVRFDNKDFDELYWNLNGNFWQIETDSFSATINFPKDIDKNSIKEINLYSGSSGQNDDSISLYKWNNDNSILLTSSRPLEAGKGVTLSVTFPKGKITPYKPDFTDKNGNYLFLLIPLITLSVCFNIWQRFGKDFKLIRPIIAEYDIPLNLAPMEFGILYQNGRLTSQMISAAIINLAVNKYIKIEQIEATEASHKSDFYISKIANPDEYLAVSDQNLLGYLFESGTRVKLSDLKNKFYDKIPLLKKTALSSLESKGLFDATGFRYQTLMFVISFILIAVGIFLASKNPLLMVNIILSGFIVLIFALLMPKRTRAGAEAFWKIQGFRLFINMTEKYRQQFNEKLNAFEKFLPYAMIFGLTKVWIDNMKKVYGEDCFNAYHPYWFYSAVFAFDANTFNDTITDLSSHMSSAISANPSGSGAGGGGFAGGGGGGGGGGGW